MAKILNKKIEELLKVNKKLEKKMNAKLKQVLD